MRVLEILHNTSDASISTTFSTGGDLGSDLNTRLLSNPALTGLPMAITDQSGVCCDPVLGFVWGGVGAAQVAIPTFADGSEYYRYEWTLTLEPGETKILMHFVIQKPGDDPAAAQTQAEALQNLTDSRALFGMSAAEKAALVNFVIP